MSKAFYQGCACTYKHDIESKVDLYVIDRAISNTLVELEKSINIPWFPSLEYMVEDVVPKFLRDLCDELTSSHVITNKTKRNYFVVDGLDSILALNKYDLKKEDKGDSYVYTISFVSAVVARVKVLKAGESLSPIKHLEITSTIRAMDGDENTLGYIDMNFLVSIKKYLPDTLHAIFQEASFLKGVPVDLESVMKSIGLYRLDLSGRLKDSLESNLALMLEEHSGEILKNSSKNIFYTDYHLHEINVHDDEDKVIANVSYLSEENIQMEIALIWVKG